MEMRFAHLKVQHGVERMCLRGLIGARDEFHLAGMCRTSNNDAAPPRPGNGWRMCVDCVRELTGRFWCWQSPKLWHGPTTYSEVFETARDVSQATAEVACGCEL